MHRFIPGGFSLRQPCYLTTAINDNILHLCSHLNINVLKENFLETVVKLQGAGFPQARTSRTKSIVLSREDVLLCKNHPISKRAVSGTWP